MSFNLKPADGRAIDLLLDRQRTVAAGGNGMDTDGMSRSFSPHMDVVNPESLEAAERVLSLLSLIPQEEPPAGLVEKTMARIEGSLDTRDRHSYRHPIVDTTTHA